MHRSSKNSVDSHQEEVRVRDGKVVIISGPSGAGKTTIVKGLVERCDLPLEVSVSATTRAPRAGEVDGVDYHFLSPEEFERRRNAGDFLECFEVFGRGYWYGTLRETVTTSLQRGNWVILEIDVQGMAAAISDFPDALSFFIRPESLEELERRLRGRGTETEETIQRRLEVARHEWLHKDRYHFDVVNDSIDATIDLMCEQLKSGLAPNPGVHP